MRVNYEEAHRVGVLDAHSAMMLATIFDAKWYDRALEKALDHCYSRPEDSFLSVVGDRLDDLRLLLMRYRAKKRLINNDIRSVR